LLLEETNIQNENNRQVETKIAPKSQNQNGGVQLSTRYEQYDFAKRHLREISRPQVFPFRDSSKEDIQEEGVSPKQGKRVRRPDISATIDANYWKGAGSTRQMIEVVGMLDDEKWRKFNESSRRVYSPKGIAPTIPTVAGGGHTPKVDVTRYPLKFLERNQKNIEGDYAYTVDGANTGGIRIGMKIRKLTPLECLRLQSFPDSWFDVPGLSDTQKYKQAGNAVTVNVVQYIVSKLTP